MDAITLAYESQLPAPVNPVMTTAWSPNYIHISEFACSTSLFPVTWLLNGHTCSWIYRFLPCLDLLVFVIISLPVVGFMTWSLHLCWCIALCVRFFRIGLIGLFVWPFLLSGYQICLLPLYFVFISYSSRTLAPGSNTKDHYQKLLLPRIFLVWLASQLAWPEPHREAVKYCQEEDEKHQSQKYKMMTVINLGFNKTSTVLQANHLHAMPHLCSNLY